MEEDIKPDRKINIKGLVCPYTFVKAKLAVEDMEIGQVIEILLDYGRHQGAYPNQWKTMAKRS